MGTANYEKQHTKIKYAFVFFLIPTKKAINIIVIKFHKNHKPIKQ